MRSNQKPKHTFAKLALCAALAAVSVGVQAQTTTSAVGGRVTGPDGKGLSGAAVTITHVESGSTTTAVTDAQGRYISRGLRTGGPYTVTIVKDGASEKREGVFLQLFETASVDAVLPRREVVVVTGSQLIAEKFDKQNMGANTTITKQDLDSMASIQRNLQDYARLDTRVSQPD